MKRIILAAVAAVLLITVGVQVTSAWVPRGMMMNGGIPSGGGGGGGGSSGCTSPAVPAQATAAGFTTLAYCIDFSQTLPANWIGCYPADGNTHPWYFGVPFNDGVAAHNPPCSSISQQTDPLTGGTALEFAWLPSYANFFANCPYCGVIGISQADTTQTRFTVTPQNSYVRVTYRTTPTLHGAYTSLYNPVGQMSGASNTTGATDIEHDTIETYGDCLAACYDAAIHNTPTGASAGIWNGATANLGAGYDPTQYHSYAMLTTSDGSTGIVDCSIVDGAVIACQNVPGAISNDEFHQKNPYFFIAGCNANAGSTDCASRPPAEVDTYVTSIMVWSCAAFATGYCNGTTKVNGPVPALTYWH